MASCAQITKKIAIIAIQIAILNSGLDTFRRTISQEKPVVSKRTPIITKSESVQCTSLVNSIAIRGITNSTAIDARISINLLFFIQPNKRFLLSLSMMYNYTLLF